MATFKGLEEERATMNLYMDCKHNRSVEGT